MNLSLSTTESGIVEYLSHGPKRTLEIVQSLCASQNITREAVYAALRKLERRSIIIVYQGVSSLSISWIRSQEAFMRNTLNSYSNELAFEAFLKKDLSHFKQETFTFKNASELMRLYHELILLRISPQKKPTPYIHFGFAPWIHPLYPAELESFFNLLLSYNYIPCKVANKPLVRKSPILDSLRSRGYRIAYMGDRDVPHGFEGEYVNDLCFQNIYPEPAFTKFTEAFRNPKISLSECKELFESMGPVTLRVYKKKNLFPKRAYDQLGIATII